MVIIKDEYGLTQFNMTLDKQASKSGELRPGRLFHSVCVYLITMHRRHGFHLPILQLSETKYIDKTCGVEVKILAESLNLKP